MPRTALFSPKLNTCKPDMKEEEEIISHTTGTRTRDLATTMIVIANLLAKAKEKEDSRAKSINFRQNHTLLE